MEEGGIEAEWENVGDVDGDEDIREWDTVQSLCSHDFCSTSPSRNLLNSISGIIEF